MHRLFVALRPPPAQRKLCLAAMEDGPPGWAWQDDEQLHVTLRFIGEVDRPVAEDIATALGSVRAAMFDLRVQGVGRFEQRSGGALWAGVEPKAPVAALAGKVERACVLAGLEPERRAFHPHITLARWKGRAPGLDRYLERHAGFKSEPWQVREFILHESHLGRAGAHYEAVAEYSVG